MTRKTKIIADTLQKDNVEAIVFITVKDDVVQDVIIECDETLDTDSQTNFIQWAMDDLDIFSEINIKDFVS